MKTYQVSYDLRTPGRNYSEISSSIRKIAVEFSHILQSTWLIKTPMSIEQVTKRISWYCDVNDELLVTEINQLMFIGPEHQWCKGDYVHPLAQALQNYYMRKALGLGPFNS